MKILVITLSYFDSGIYWNFFESQRQTWDSIDVEGVRTLFLVGNCEKNEIEGNIIKTEYKESWNNCGRKTLKALELIKDFDYDYIFRTNSSSYVDKELLKKYLEDKPKTDFYSGIIGNLDKINFASGSGFFLSKNLVDLVVSNKEQWNHGYIDDVALGLLLSTKGIYPVPALRYDILSGNETIPTNFYHYRLKSSSRKRDCERMKKIYLLKNP